MDFSCFARKEHGDRNLPPCFIILLFDRFFVYYHILFSATLEKCFKEVHLALVGQAVEVESLMDDHHRGFVLFVGSPIGQRVTVGIACLGEVNPIARHDLLHVTLGIGHATALKAESVDERHLSNMAGTASFAAENGVFGVLVEVVHIYTSLAGLGLQVGPGVGAPGKATVAEDV